MSTRKTAANWTPTHVQRLWDWCASNAHMQQSYFSYQVGKGITNFLDSTGRLKGKVLDYGCGTGYLLNHLLARGLECYGVDSSQQSINEVNAKFANYQNWRPGKIIENFVTPFQNNYFDVITCIETLEHILNEQVYSLLAELKRLIRPGGIVLITTPYNEKLDDNLMYCPFCDSEFHRWQHMQSFTINSMQSLLSTHGFSVDFCQGMDFEQFNDLYSFTLSPVATVNLSKLKGYISFRTKRLLDRLFPLPFPQGRVLNLRLKSRRRHHLCTIATKR